MSTGSKARLDVPLSGSHLKANQSGDSVRSILESSTHLMIDSKANTSVILDQSGQDAGGRDLHWSSTLRI